MILKQDTANSLGSHKWWLSRCLQEGKKQKLYKAPNAETFKHIYINGQKKKKKKK